MKIAVIGLGSIGKRHAANLRALGCGVLTVDVNGEADYADVRALPPVDAAVICVPSEWQVGTAMYMNGPLFIEKPCGTGNADLLRQYDWVQQVGFNLRFIPSLLAFRNRLRNGEVGEVLWANVSYGQNLQTWRPGRDYRSTPAQDGVLLEASHELDLIHWLFGPVRRIIGASVRKTVFDVRDDYAAALLEMESGATVELHLDMTTPGYMRSVTVGGTRDTLRCEPFGSGPIPDKDVVSGMYVAEIHAFLESVETGVLAPHAATVEDAIAVHRVIAMIREAVDGEARRQLKNLIAPQRDANAEPIQ